MLVTLDIAIFGIVNGTGILINRFGNRIIANRWHFLASFFGTMLVTELISYRNGNQIIEGH